jgi:hypothetical protein
VLEPVRERRADRDHRRHVPAAARATSMPPPSPVTSRN